MIRLRELTRRFRLKPAAVRDSPSCKKETFPDVFTRLKDSLIRLSQEVRVESRWRLETLRHTTTANTPSIEYLKVLRPDLSLKTLSKHLSWFDNWPFSATLGIGKISDQSSADFALRRNVNESLSNGLSKTRLTVRSLKLSAKNMRADHVRMIERLCEVLHRNPWTKTAALDEGASRVLLLLRYKGTPETRVMAQEALGLLGHHDPVPGHGIRILAIDGGGMKGFAALEALKALEIRSGKRACELFDLVCGVSTGAIIAAFLGFHQKSATQVHDVYVKIGKKIFQQSRLNGAKGWVLSHSYYDTKMFEKVLRQRLGTTKTLETQRSLGTPKVALISCQVEDSGRVSPYVFRNYVLPYRVQSSYEGSHGHPIWTAVRASTAAPGYFDHFTLDGRVHQDGGLIANNATQIAIHEAQKIWPATPLQCVISLGLGRTDASFLAPRMHRTAEDGDAHPTSQVRASDGTKSFSLSQKFASVVESATDTELVHETLHDLLPGNVYYRFNPYLGERFLLDETRAEKILMIIEQTQMYLRRNHNKLRDACDQLTKPKSIGKSMMERLHVSWELFRAKRSTGPP